MNRYSKYILPTFIVVVGLCWLLESMQVISGGQVLWVSLLTLAGISCFIAWGRTAQGLQWGPFLLACAVCALLRIKGVLDVRQEIPLLVIVFGACMALSRSRLARPPAQGPAEPSAG